jgi:S-layer homology domain
MSGKIMNFRSPRRSTVCLVALSLGIATSAVLPHVHSSLTAPAVAQTNSSFPDTQNYWGQPFIQALAERNVVTGYLDNTFRPEQPMARDEFAAIVRKAFSLPAERQISSGSVYNDIPEGYWAEPAIKEAYEMGFVSGYPSGEFRPNQAITRVDVLSALAQNLNLPTATAANNSQTSAAANNQTDDQPTATAVAPVVPVAPATDSAVTDPAATQSQPANRRRARRPLLFPLGMTTLMQPFVTNTVRAVAAPVQTAAPAEAPAPTEATSPSPAPDAETASQNAGGVNLSEYYDDAAQIPQEAADAVAKTTAAGIVVNHPDPRLLNPNQPATRGEVAALVHQALVHQGTLEPLPENTEVGNYIVGR